MSNWRKVPEGYDYIYKCIEPLSLMKYRWTGLYWFAYTTDEARPRPQNKLQSVYCNFYAIALLSPYYCNTNKQHNEAIIGCIKQCVFRKRGSDYELKACYLSGPACVMGRGELKSVLWPDKATGFLENMWPASRGQRGDWIGFPLPLPFLQAPSSGLKFTHIAS